MGGLEQFDEVAGGVGEEGVVRLAGHERVFGSHCLAAGTPWKRSGRALEPSGTPHRARLRCGAAVLSRERLMNPRRAFSVAAALVLAAAGVVGLGQPASAAPFFATPDHMHDPDVQHGNLLTAVGGGGRTADVIHTNAT
jgi:hypothetical protein